MPNIAFPALANTVLSLLHRIARCASADVLTIAPNPQHRFAEIAIRWYLKIGQCRHPLEHSRGKIEARTMAGTEITLWPVGSQILGCYLRAEAKHTTEMRAYTDDHQVFSMYGAQLISRIGRLLAADQRIGIMQVGYVRRHIQLFQYREGAAQYLHRFMAPLHDDPLPRSILLKSTIKGAPPAARAHLDSTKR